MEEKKCLVFLSSVSKHRLCLCVRSTVPRCLLFLSFWNASPLCFIGSFLPKSFGERWRGEERGGPEGSRMSHQQCSPCGLSEASCRPCRPPAPCAASGRCSTVRGRRSGGGLLRRRWAWPVSCVQPSGRRPPSFALCPCSRRRRIGERREGPKIKPQ